MSKRLLTEHSDVFSCPVCFENYETSGNHTPRIFPCTHTVCHKCIGNIIQRGELNCPTCRKKYKTANGQISFPENPYIIDTLKVFAKKEEEEFELCKEHKRELSLKCKDCQKVICQLCLVKDHKCHAVTDIIEEHQEKIKNMVQFLLRRRFGQMLVLKKSQNTLTQLEKVKKEHMDKFDNMIKNVAKDLSHVKDNIECCEKEIKELVTKSKNVRKSGRVKKEEVESIRNALSGRNEKKLPCRYFKYHQPSAPENLFGKLEEKRVSLPQFRVVFTIDLPNYRNADGNHLSLVCQFKFKTIFKMERKIK